MIPALSPARAVLRFAAALDFVREVPKNSNWGQAVQAFLRLVGWQKPAPWCAAYVAFVGRAALGDAWPLPSTASCYQLGDAARKTNLLRDTPVEGAVFLLHYAKLDRFAHTGFVTRVHPDGRCDTIEGNTNDGGSRDGWGVFRRTRTFGPRDRFIHWMDA